MIVGHYAAALLLRSRLRDQPFWILLFAANLPEFLWLLFALLGLEPTLPASIFDATVSNIQVDMTYSHNLIPAVIQGLILSGLIFGWRRHAGLALACGALTVFHVLCDYIVGYQHQIWDRSSTPIGFNSYVRAPYLALLVELLFCLAAIFWFQWAEKKRGHAVPARKISALVLVFAAGVLMWLPTVRTPISAWFSD